ncbi:MAG: DUF1987 domain-containing protein [Magnetococcales bacterium]|nr:DUF1987 domain-containing protein [Magnetococcales bacterium]
MEDLILAATQSSPEVQFIYSENKLIFKGKSYIENTAQFYDPIFGWLTEYLAQAHDQRIEAHLSIIYFNSSSFKVFMNFFDLLDDAAEHGRNTVTVYWYHDADDDMSQEYGEEFREDLRNIAFHLVATTDNDNTPLMTMN